MKNRARLFTFLTLALIAVGALAFLSSPPPALADSGPEDDAKALMKLDEEWSKAAATRNVDLVASFYAENGNAYPPNEPAAIGHAAAKKLWSTYFSDPSFKVSWKTTKAEVGGAGDMGYTVAAYEVSINGPDGKAINEKGKCLCVWKKQKDGSWKAIHDMWNADAK